MGLTGTQFILRFSLLGESVFIDSPPFDIFPGDLEIVSVSTPNPKP